MGIDTPLRAAVPQRAPLQMCRRMKNHSARRLLLLRVLPRGCELKSQRHP